jgi:hypothetical protein
VKRVLVTVALIALVSSGFLLVSLFRRSSDWNLFLDDRVFWLQC